MRISVCTPSIRPEGLKITQECLSKQTFQDFEWLVEIGIPERGCDLNAAYNRMLRRAKGDLIVSLQDYTKVQDDFLGICWNEYQWAKDTFFTVAVGKTMDWEEVEWDWRKEKRPINWMEWEIDCGFAPLKALKEIGGFDEELDKGWSYDNVNVGLRAEMAGYKFEICDLTRAVAFCHNRVIEHPFLKQQDAILHNNRLDEIRQGLKLTF